MASTTHVPLEVCLRSCYEPDAEYVDGEIEKRPAAEYDHASWQQAICYWFQQNAKDRNIRVRPELPVQVAPTRFRVPDVTILDRDQPTEQIITHSPVAVFEVLSPKDTVRRLMRKLNDYCAMGIPEIWVADPETRIFSRFEDGQLVRRDSFSFPSKGIAFATRQVEDLLD